MLLPSGVSHLPLIVPPTPLANGVLTTSGGMLSLNGLPKKPQTTGPLVAGVTAGPAWMWAAVRLSFASLRLRAGEVDVVDRGGKRHGVSAVLRLKVAVPKDAGLRAPPVVVGFVGGFS